MILSKHDGKFYELLLNFTQKNFSFLLLACIMNLFLQETIKKFHSRYCVRSIGRMRMHNKSHFRRKFLCNISAVLIFSFCAAGCHLLRDAATQPQVTVKKEKIGQGTAPVQDKADAVPSESRFKTKKYSPETSSKKDASGFLLTKSETPKKIPSEVLLPKIKSVKTSHNEMETDVTLTKDPFSVPSALRKPITPSQNLKNYSQSLRQTFANTSVSATYPSSNPTYSGKGIVLKEISEEDTHPVLPRTVCLAGIFDNGKEKFALLRWQHTHGIFRQGDRLENGYYIRKITESSISLCPSPSQEAQNEIILKL